MPETALFMMHIKPETKLQDLLALAHHDFEGRLNAHAFFKTHDHSVGEDLVQDTFTKTWKYLVKGGKIDVMKSFLYHVLNNLIVDEYRKHKSSSLNEMMDNKGFEPSHDGREKLFDILDGHAAALLIQHLPIKYREIIKLRYMKNLSIQEISDLTGMTKNLVTVQAHRGLEKLKQLYNHN